MDILVNGKKSAVGKPGTYVTLSRRWQNGDRIEFALPIGLKATAYTGFDTIPPFNRYAMEYGPILLALIGKTEAPLVINGKSELTSALIPDAGKPLHFSVANNVGYRYVPYWQLEPNQNFTVFPVVKTDAGSESNTPIKRNPQ
jgi:hypothetical protein